MGKLESALVLAVILFAVMVMGVGAAQAHERDTEVWWVYAKWPKDIEWIAMASAMSYEDCVDRALPKARMLINKTTAWAQPRFKCEVKP